MQLTNKKHPFYIVSGNVFTFPLISHGANCHIRNLKETRILIKFYSYKCIYLEKLAQNFFLAMAVGKGGKLKIV